jgi:hypothetical protein
MPERHSLARIFFGIERGHKPKIENYKTIKLGVEIPLISASM